MREPDWAKVLRYLYEEDSTVGFSTYYENPENHVAVGRTGVDPQRIQLVLKDMREYGLVEKEINVPTVGDPVKNEIAIYSLTEKGFDVAHDRMESEHKRHLDTLIGVFTLILAAGTLTQALVALVQLDNWETALIISGSVSVIIALGGLALFKFLGLHPIRDLREWAASHPLS